MAIDLTTVGAFVAFGLAGLKVIEFFRDRKPELSLTTVFRGNVELGHDLIIMNSSKVPASIYYYELLWVKPGVLRNLLGIEKEVAHHEFSLEDDTCDITIGGHSLVKLNFSEGDYFKWGSDLKNDLYLKLSIVGRKRPLWLWVQGP